MVRDLLEEHEPVTDDLARYRFHASTRRRYDRLDAYPRGQDHRRSLEYLGRR